MENAKQVAEREEAKKRLGDLEYTVALLVDALAPPLSEESEKYFYGLEGHPDYPDDGCDHKQIPVSGSAIVSDVREYIAKIGTEEDVWQTQTPQQAGGLLG